VHSGAGSPPQGEGAPGAPPSTEAARLDRRLVALLAVATGAGAANLWYVQPLLNEIGRAFSISDAAAGLLVTFVQAGYVIGLAFLVPLGDLLERRSLIVRLMLATAVAAVACAVSPSVVVLYGALTALGLTACVAQILVPLASHLAGPQERGQVVGTVMSGLLVGVLLARTVSGLIAEVAGWRAVYGVAAVIMVVLAAVLRRVLPPVRPTADVRYRALLGSVLTLVREEPVLRQRMAIGALTMAAFTGLWTTSTLLLGAAPFDYSEGVIGLFGIAGVAGALIAPLAGGWADRGHGRLALTVFLVLLLVGWGLLALASTSIVAFIAGVVVFDLGVQGAHINNQSVIYALAPDARSRLTTAYMTAYFLGGTAGSVLASAAFDLGGWADVCWLGAILAGLTLAVWAATQRVGRRAAAAISER
jgi:predicted MFS family arabinose efflux permease